LFEPAEHDAVEGVRGLDDREVPHAGDLLVARARDQAGETPVLAGRGAGVVLAVDDQGRHAYGRQPRGTVEIENAGGAAEITGRRGGRDGGDERPAALQ